MDMNKLELSTDPELFSITWLVVLFSVWAWRRSHISVGMCLTGKRSTAIYGKWFKLYFHKVWQAKPRFLSKTEVKLTRTSPKKARGCLSNSGITLQQWVELERHQLTPSSLSEWSFFTLVAFFLLLAVNQVERERRWTLNRESLSQQ